MPQDDQIFFDNADRRVPEDAPNPNDKWDINPGFRLTEDGQFYKVNKETESHYNSSAIEHVFKVTAGGVSSEISIAPVEVDRFSTVAAVDSCIAAKIEGTKYDSGKIRLELLPPEFLESVADILTFGASKYGDRNWEKGMAWSRPFGALMRHMWAWFRGEDCDPETGKSHLWHAGCNIAFLITYEERQIGHDDRPIKKEVS